MTAQTENADQLETMGKILERQRALTASIANEHGNYLAGGASTSSIHVEAGPLIALTAIFAALLAMAVTSVLCVASIGIMLAWRQADTAELNRLRAEYDQTSAFVVTHERRINKLENPTK